MSRRVAAVATLAAGALALAACGGSSPTSATTSTNRLEVVSWWTSGSEAAALGVLFSRFRAAHAGVKAINGAVPGGAGSNAIVALAKRLQHDDPPDVWQTFAGKSLQDYAGRSTVRSLKSVFDEEHLRAAIQPTILKGLLRDGRPYGVPTGAHRSNVLWFNRSVLRQAGVRPPSAGYTLTAFLADLQKVKTAGKIPLCLGGRDRFTTAELFENTLLSSIGRSGWNDMVDDKLHWRGDRVRSALTSFGTMLDHADPEAKRLTWDQATRKLGSGGCAFESMNDSAYGELVASGAKEGRDFGAVAFPGTSGAFLAVVDVFVVATQAHDAKNALAFVRGIEDPATQIRFSRAKGSVPVVRDVPVSSLPAYQRASSNALWRSPVLLSVAHGEAMSPEFQEGFYDAVSSYARRRDKNRFARHLEDAVAHNLIPQR